MAIGIGLPKHAKRYCSKLAPDLYCFTTNNSETYFRYGIQSASIKELMSSNVFSAIARNAIRGNFGGKPTGDLRLLPATFLVDRTGIIRFTYYSKDVADQPSTGLLIERASPIATNELN